LRTIGCRWRRWMVNARYPSGTMPLLGVSVPRRRSRQQGGARRAAASWPYPARDRLKSHSIDIQAGIHLRTLVFTSERHAFIAPTRRRVGGVSGAGAGARLDDFRMGRRPPLAWERLELPRFPAGEVDREAFSRRIATPLLERNTLKWLGARG
jgi:hypothetical protein